MFNFTFNGPGIKTIAIQINYILEYSKIKKNEIIKYDSDLIFYTLNELSEWLVSNFVNILSDQKIFVSSVNISPIIESGYKTLLSIKAKNEKSHYQMEFGLLESADGILNAMEFSNRLTILSLEMGFPSQEILYKLKETNFNFSKINGVNTLILY